MRILIVNKYYFLKGGTERLMGNISAILEAHGHTVVPLAIRFSRNEPTSYAQYFLDPPAGENAVQLEQFRLRLHSLPRMLMAAFYSLQAKARVRRIIREQQIDLVLSINISNYISPSIIDGAHKENTPIVHCVADYNLLCPNAMFNRSGKDICFDCMPGKYWHGIMHRCIDGSLGASAVRCASMFFHDLSRVYHRVDAFACLTPYMIELLTKRGFQRDKLFFLPTPIDAAQIEPGTEDDGSFLFFGGISRWKGADLLIEAGRRMKSKHARILIAGDTSTLFAKQCLADVKRSPGLPVEFVGPRYGDELWDLIRRCRATIVPSRWLDNLPNVLLESSAAAKPIIGSNVAGVSVVVRDGENGLLFAPGDAADLARKLDALAEDPERARRMGLAGRRLAEEEYSPERHYESLMKVFEAAIAQRGKKHRG